MLTQRKTAEDYSECSTATNTGVPKSTIELMVLSIICIQSQSTVRYLQLQYE